MMLKRSEADYAACRDSATGETVGHTQHQCPILQGARHVSRRDSTTKNKKEQERKRDTSRGDVSPFQGYVARPDFIRNQGLRKK